MLDRGAFVSAASNQGRKVNMRRYRLELVCESGEDEPEEMTLRTSTDVAIVYNRENFSGRIDPGAS